LIPGFIRRAGVLACIAVCGACAQVAVQVASMAVTPTVAAFARHVDQSTARRIVELDQKQDWPGMAALAQAQLQRDATSANWWWLQGYALARQDQHAAAVESYQQALRISPEDENTWLSLAQSQDALGRSDLAVRAYRQALRNRPESAQAYLALAEHYMQHGDPDRALPNYRESVRYDAYLAQSWYGLATAYNLTGQNERRDEALQGLRKLDPAAADQLEKQFRAK
jgi:cytochrome c-type biogenesis protein CcmH/NrfG